MAYKQDKYTKSARMQECQVRIPGVCCFDPETTVFAHINGGGMADKHLNIHGAYCCNMCHDQVDGRVPLSFSRELINLWFLEGVIRTQIIMVRNGVLKL